MSYHKQYVLGIMLQVKLVGNTSQNVSAPVLSFVDPVPKDQEYFKKRADSTSATLGFQDNIRGM